uniref:Ribosomal protein S11 n=1 Tax=Melanthalia intermedia TaxID=172989 RepID=A0A345UBP4_9FLOR|nr:ribosomal protein S11 [Melanthalia intermedia]AXI97880.1 ribosomal protein S11 [Melanthalia intermedia]
MKHNNQKSVRLIILFTSNNILYSVTNIEGITLFWTSVGTKRIKGTKKLTLITIMSSVKLILHFIWQLKIKYIYLELKGLNKNKKTFLRYFKQLPINVLTINNDSLFGHNGCKKSKLRRI